MPLCSDGHYRFPRLPSKSGNHSGKLSRTDTFAERVAKGDIPRGYDRVTKPQKKLIRMIVDGMSVRKACAAMHIDTDTFYRWRRCSQAFRKYLYDQAVRTSSLVESRLDSKLPRAVRIVEDALDSPDPYFAYDAATDLLRGRGKFASSVKEKREITGALDIHSKVITEHQLSPRLVLAFVDALVGKAQQQGPEVPVAVQARPQKEESQVVDATIVRELPSASSDTEIPPREVKAESDSKGTGRRKGSKWR